MPSPLCWWPSPWPPLRSGTPSAAGESLLAGLGLPEIVVTTDGTDFDPPTEIEAGRYRVVLVNTSDSTATDLEFYKAPEGMTVDDIEPSIAWRWIPESGLPPDVFFEPGFAHGGAVAWPGSEGDVVLDLTPGDWGLFLPVLRRGYRLVRRHVL